MISIRLPSFALALGLSLGAGVAAAQGCPDWSRQGAQLTFDSDGLWAPQAVQVVAGGNVDLTQCGIRGMGWSAYGWVITSPDFDLAFTRNDAGRDLELRVEANCDTVLLVNDASGQWHFNDDTNGLNPAVRIPRAPAGAYDIWVGTYDRATCEARLILETFGTPPGGAAGAAGMTPQGMAGGSMGGMAQGGMAGAMQGALPDPGTLMMYRGYVGQTLAFVVTGSQLGEIWGTGVYSDDSPLATAAVHAGMLMPGQTGIVQVMILPGQMSYSGSTMNGVTSLDYGATIGAYQFVGLVAEPGLFNSR